MNYKNSQQTKKQKHPFLHIRASCLETGRATTPIINTNHNYTLTIQKEQYSRPRFIARSPWYLQTDNNDNRPIT